MKGARSAQSRPYWIRYVVAFWAVERCVVLVSVTSFGSLWRYRFSKDQKDQNRFAWGVYYNMTGVRVAGAIRQRPKIVGYARFHQCSGFDPHYPAHMMGRVFDCAEPSIWQGTNKLLFQHLLRRPEMPERFLGYAAGADRQTSDRQRRLAISGHVAYFV